MKQREEKKVPRKLQHTLLTHRRVKGKKLNEMEKKINQIENK